MGRAARRHFDGVTTVVAKLFSIVGPCRAYFGRKDAQQLAVIRRMTADLDLPVDVVGCPLVREPDGLAMSSRNAYLIADERDAATVLAVALRAAGEAAARGRDATPSTLRTMIVDTVAGVSRWSGSTTPRSSTPRRSSRVATVDRRHAGRGRRVRRHDPPDRQRHHRARDIVRRLRRHRMSAVDQETP